jgi:hypothetical protein
MRHSRQGSSAYCQLEKSSTGKVHGVPVAAVKQNITPLQVPQQLYRLLRVPTEARHQKASAPARDVSRRASRAFSPVPEFSSCTQGVLHEDTAPLPIVDGSGTPAQGV